MARKITMGSDVNTFVPMCGNGILTRFAVEVGDDTIVTPLLFATDPRVKGYTATAPKLVVLHARGEDHLRLLNEHVVPQMAAVARLFVVDADTHRVYGRLDAGAEFGSCDLAEMCRSIASSSTLQSSDHDAKAAELQRGFEALPTGAAALELLASERVLARIAEATVRAEAEPLRLWEAMFWRGENYRWELIAGEVPLVGELWSPLAANRTLVRCVTDAEHAFKTKADERHGWIVCGPMRFQQRASRVEIRFRPSPPDRRAAFMPATRIAGDDANPSLFGALISGGHKGKTELFDNYSESVVLVHPDRRSEEVARALADDVRRIAGAACEVSAEDEDGSISAPRDGSWSVHWADTYVTVCTPMYRADRLPWDIHSGLGLSDDALGVLLRHR